MKLSEAQQELVDALNRAIELADGLSLGLVAVKAAEAKHHLDVAIAAQQANHGGTDSDQS